MSEDEQYQLINQYIEYRRNPDNIGNGSILKFFFVNKLYLYWDKLENYIDSLESEKDIGNVFFSKSETFVFDPLTMEGDAVEKGILLKKLKKIRIKMPMYRKKFSEDIGIIINNNFQIRFIWDLFNFISNIFCLFDSKDILKKKIDDVFFSVLDNNLPRGYDRKKKFKIFEKFYTRNFDKFFPIVNGTGFYTPELFLYAYINDIYLIGIPYQNNFIESNNYKSCPIPFMWHDIDHLYRMSELSQEDIDKIKLFYKKLVNDKAITEKQKRNHIISLFIIVHEMIVPIEVFFNYLNLSFLDTAINEFSDKYRKYRSFTDTEELRDMIFTSNIDFEGNIYDKLEIRDFNDLEKNWHSSMTQPFISTLLGLAYTSKYINKNIDKL